MNGLGCLISNQCNTTIGVIVPNKVLLITVPYGQALVLPLSIVDQLEHFQVVDGGTYDKKALNYSRSPLDCKIIDRSNIGPMGEDEVLIAKKKAEYKAELVARLAEISKEV